METLYVQYTIINIIIFKNSLYIIIINMIIPKSTYELARPSHSGRTRSHYRRESYPLSGWSARQWAGTRSRSRRRSCRRFSPQMRAASDSSREMHWQSDRNCTARSCPAAAVFERETPAQRPTSGTAFFILFIKYKELSSIHISLAIYPNHGVCLIIRAPASFRMVRIHGDDVVCRRFGIRMEVYFFLSTERALGEGFDWLVRVAISNSLWWWGRQMEGIRSEEKF